MQLLHDGTTLAYNDVYIPYPRFRNFLYKVSDELEINIDERLLFDHKRSFELPEVIYDDPTSRELGYNWTRHEKNATFVSKYSDNYFLNTIIMSNPNSLASSYTVSIASQIRVGSG
jgi:hypothetical protein